MIKLRHGILHWQNDYMPQNKLEFYLAKLECIEHGTTACIWLPSSKYVNTPGWYFDISSPIAHPICLDISNNLFFKYAIKHHKEIHPGWLFIKVPDSHKDWF